jgi:hypothetical protein
MSDEVLEPKYFGYFEKLREFQDAQQSILALDLFEVPSEEERDREWQFVKRIYGIVRLLNTSMQQDFKYLHLFIAC